MDRSAIPVSPTQHNSLGFRFASSGYLLLQPGYLLERLAGARLPNEFYGASPSPYRLLVAIEAVIRHAGNLARPSVLAISADLLLAHDLRALEHDDKRAPPVVDELELMRISEIEGTAVQNVVAVAFNPSKFGFAVAFRKFVKILKTKNASLLTSK